MGPSHRSPQSARLGYVLPGPVLTHGDSVLMEARGYSALEATARHWPGELVVIAPTIISVDTPMLRAHSRIAFSDLPFAVVEAEPEPEAIDAQGLDLVTGLLAAPWRRLTAARTPAVLTAEVNYGIRLGIYRATLKGLPLARAAVGLVKVERGIREQARAARSLQCNGPAATKTYGPLTADPLSYMDHRITRADVHAANGVEAWNGDRPLRLAFSGRLDPIKGPQYAVELARRARSAGLPVEFGVFGSGPLEEDLRAGAEAWMEFRGFRDFRTHWLDDVRQGVDLMVLPHQQGDPSCTYFEALGSGAPVLGFHNATLTPLVREHGIGWATRRGDVEGLLQQLVRILNDPDLLQRARRAGLDLVGRNDFESTTARRVAHLRRHAAVM